MSDPRPGGLPDASAGTTVLVPASAGGLVERTVCANGVRVVTEAVPTMRSAAVGIWLAVGARDEQPRLNGAAHFLEHLLFKGTGRRSALDISATLEAVGGELNAFTSRENTAYYARVIDADLPLAVDVLSDMLTGSVIRPEDVESERQVILEEIAMHDDEPGDVANEGLFSALFGHDHLGRPVIGTRQTLTEMTRQDVHQFYRERYRPERTVVAVAGNVTHAAVLAAVQESLGGAGWDAAMAPDPLRSPTAVPAAAAQTVVVERPTEQAHLAMGVPTFDRRDRRRHALAVLVTAVGGGMSSRLFQRVREERGLVYAISSYVSHHAGAGLLGTYAGTSAGRLPEVIEVITAECADIRAGGLSSEEIERARGQLRGSLVLGSEDSGSRMNRLGASELGYGEYLSLSEHVQRITAVTDDEVHTLAAELLAQPWTLSVVGPVTAAQLGSAA